MPQPSYLWPKGGHPARKPVCKAAAVSLLPPPPISNLRQASSRVSSPRSARVARLDTAGGGHQQQNFPSNGSPGNLTPGTSFAAGQTRIRAAGQLTERTRTGRPRSGLVTPRGLGIWNMSDRLHLTGLGRVLTGSPAGGTVEHAPALLRRPALPPPPPPPAPSPSPRAGR